MRWFEREPRRSRVLVVASVLVAVAAGALTARDRSPWSFPAIVVVGVVPALTVSVAVLLVAVRSMRTAARSARPRRFVVAGGGFGVPPLIPAGLLAGLPILLSGNVAGSAVEHWRQVSAPVAPAPPPAPAIAAGFAVAMAVLAAAGLAVAALGAVFAWNGGSAFRLTPDGLSWRNPLFRRTVPWAALARGGPLPPALGVERLELVVARPELVRQRGWAVGSGTEERPVVMLQTAVHAWFLTGAIRWYVEHPADRAAIGTEVEHARLVAVLPPVPVSLPMEATVTRCR